jgi:exopolysaccharide biosynthesis WecB/TagA/CpsF family protein
MHGFSYKFFFSKHLEALTAEQACKQLLKLLEKSKAPIWVYTFNFEMLTRMLDRSDYCAEVGSIDYWIADGSPIKWLYQTKLPHKICKISGIDLSRALLVESSNSLSDYRVFILGNADIEKLESKLGIKLGAKVHVNDGQFTLPDDLEKIKLELENFKPSIVLIGLGVPKQDLIASYLRRTLLHPCLIVGNGGSLEILQGKRRMANMAIRRMHLEWAWRFLQEPRRLFYRYFFYYPKGLILLLRFQLSNKKKGEA